MDPRGDGRWRRAALIAWLIAKIAVFLVIGLSSPEIVVVEYQQF